MIFDLRADLLYRFDDPAEVLLLVEAADHPAQTVLSQSLAIEPASGLIRDVAQDGQRRAVFKAHGEVGLTYVARVRRPPDATDADLGIDPVAAIPADVLPWLFASRYCPSDRFVAFVSDTFAGLTDAALVQAILDWVHDHLDYRFGVSDSSTDAWDTFETRAGVCRDFTHLAISLLRAAGVPARAVSAYAFSLTPPDMHAVVEAWVGGRWRLFDPTRRAAPNNLVRIAWGADAAHIAFMTIFGSATMLKQRFHVEQADLAPA